MPSADDLAPTLDRFDDQSPPEPAKTSPIPTPPTKKSKKKGKKHVFVPAMPKYEDEEETPYAKSITPSPPMQHGVLLHPEPPSLGLASNNDAVPANFDDDTTAFEDFDDPQPELEPVRVPQTKPLTTPTVRSPRPQPAALATLSRTPPANAKEYESVSQRRQSFRSPPRQSAQPQRSSFANPKTMPSPRLSEPPLPHMPQAHFFGLPDIGLNVERNEGGKVAGSDGYCCKFDSFADAGDLGSARKAKDALLVGWEGGLDVYRILPDKLEVVGRLEGLGGGVIDAKILPHTDRKEARQDFMPHVVVVIHGPVPAEKRDSGLGQGGPQDLPNARFSRSYQTSVEVYSFRTQQHIATLYKSLPVEASEPIMGIAVGPPSPVGDLSVEASGRHVLVASGKSGEIFVFSNASYDDDSDAHDFSCLGKFWTSLQSQIDGARKRPTSLSDGSVPCTEQATSQRRRPLFSLGTRWLAVAPPATSSSISIQGSPLLNGSGLSAPGLVSHVAPAQPPISCETAGVDAEGALSRLTRQAAQGLWKASHVGLELGKQGWREFTNPSPPANSLHSRGASREHDVFPPTNAPSEDPGYHAREPALVSIVDLEELGQAEKQTGKQPPLPLVTFAVPDGCNFLSFAPNGLRLLTSNGSGEVFRVWDISRAVFANMNTASVEEDDSTKEPCVRQVQRIVRNSPSLLLDAKWSRDGEWLALASSHGTVHLHEAPLQPSLKRRRRRSTINAPAPDKADATVSISHGISPPSSNGFLGSLRSSWQTVSMQVNTMRTQNSAAAFGLPTTFAGFRETATAARNASGRAVAKSISQGYTAAKGGASDLWYAEENKVKPKNLAEFVRPGCIRWIHRRGDASIAIVCAGVVHLHPVQQVTRRKGDAIVTGLKHDRYAHKGFNLPCISTSSDEGAGHGTGTSNGCKEQGPHGFWSLGHPEAHNTRSAQADVATEISNDVETNPPYCPFHVDRRVSLFAYDDRGVQDQFVQGQGLGSDEPWVFGGPLPSSTKMNNRSQSDRTDDYDQGFNDYDPDDVAQTVESKLTIRSGPGRHEGEQINVHTKRKRRRRGGGHGEVAVDGDFELLEDDDDTFF